MVCAQPTFRPRRSTPWTASSPAPPSGHSSPPAAFIAPRASSLGSCPLALPTFLPIPPPTSSVPPPTVSSSSMKPRTFSPPSTTSASLHGRLRQRHPPLLGTAWNTENLLEREQRRALQLEKSGWPPPCLRRRWTRLPIPIPSTRVSSRRRSPSWAEIIPSSAPSTSARAKPALHVHPRPPRPDMGDSTGLSISPPYFERRPGRRKRGTPAGRRSDGEDAGAAARGCIRHKIDNQQSLIRIAFLLDVAGQEESSTSYVRSA